MKRIVVFSLLLSLISVVSVEAQVGKFLKNVKNSVTQDLLGKPDNGTKNMPEPSCACDPADQIIDLGKYNIGYTETNIDVLADGRIILQDRMEGKYYIVKDGVTEGPIKENDPRVKQFQNIVEEDDEKSALVTLYKDYISMQGNRYVINFAGKTYGPYDQVNNFATTRSKDKFIAAVTEVLVVTADEGKKMEAEMDKAKTDQEKFDLAMKYSQQMQQRMMGSGPEATQPKLISNVPVNKNNSSLVSFLNSSFNATMKYDDIVLVSQNNIMDLNGNTIFNLPAGNYDPANTFISDDNKKYATYSYGALTISDGKKLSDLFNPHLVKTGGKVYLAYMYYSPKKDAILQCKIPF